MKEFGKFQIDTCLSGSAPRPLCASTHAAAGGRREVAHDNMSKRGGRKSALSFSQQLSREIAMATAALYKEELEKERKAKEADAASKKGRKKRKKMEKERAEKAERRRRAEEAGEEFDELDDDVFPGADAIDGDGSTDGLPNLSRRPHTAPVRQSAALTQLLKGCEFNEDFLPSHLIKQVRTAAFDRCSRVRHR